LPNSHFLLYCTAVPQVFRTYNASITLDRLLAEDSGEETVDGKAAEYNRANKEVGRLVLLQHAPSAVLPLCQAAKG
jgi:hypothetical protein